MKRERGLEKKKKKDDVPLFGSETSLSATEQLAAVSCESSLLEWPSLCGGREGGERGEIEQERNNRRRRKIWRETLENVPVGKWTSDTRVKQMSKLRLKYKEISFSVADVSCVKKSVWCSVFHVPKTQTDTGDENEIQVSRIPDCGVLLTYKKGAVLHFILREARMKWLPSWYWFANFLTLITRGNYISTAWKVQIMRDIEKESIFSEAINLL